MCKAARNEEFKILIHAGSDVMVFVGEISRQSMVLLSLRVYASIDSNVMFMLETLGNK